MNLLESNVPEKLYNLWIYSNEGWSTAYQQTGVIIPCLVILALIVFAIILEKCISLRYNAVMNQDTVDVLFALERGNEKQIEHELDDLPTPQSDMVRTAHVSRDLAKDDFLNELSSNASRWIRRFNKRLVLLQAIGILAPLVGILGGLYSLMDITGLVQPGLDHNPARVESALNHALLTLILGLGVGIPSLFFQKLFKSRVTEITEEFREFSHKLMKAIYYDYGQIETETLRREQTLNAKQETTSSETETESKSQAED